MASFNNLNQLYTHIKKQSKKALEDDISRKIKQLLHDYILDEVYNNFSPEEYDRTYTLLNSITIGRIEEIGDSISVEIFIPEENLGHTTLYGSDSLGLSAGSKVPVSYVAQWLEDGYTWGRSNTDFMEKTKDEIKQSAIHLNAFIRYLKIKGIAVK